MPVFSSFRLLKLVAVVVSLVALGTVEAHAAAARSYWSCVPYAREVSDVNLSGDAWRWWAAAQGIYDRGNRPRSGAVLVFKRTDSLRRGHVAVVRQVVDSRRIVVDHANWGTGSRKGRIDTRVEVVDVSRDNDWSAVRVWYPPVRDLGTTQYPTYGFIYAPSRGPQAPSAPGGAARLHNASIPVNGPVPIALPKPTAPGAAVQVAAMPPAATPRPATPRPATPRPATPGAVTPAAAVPLPGVKPTPAD